MSEEKEKITVGTQDDTESDFIPVPDVLIKKYGYVTALVWGCIWAYCYISNGVCEEKMETIAAGLYMSERTVMRHITILETGGYLKDTTPELKNRPHRYVTTGKLKIQFAP